jgi:GNAT superfamily N-acetyltransferase
VNLAIVPLSGDEAEAVSALAREIWRHHYPPIIGTAQTEYMLAQRYDPEAIRAELASGNVWWDVLKDDGAMVAFASSFAIEDERAIKIDKLYVHPARQREGLGGALIEHTRQRAARLGLARLILAVNKRNVAAIAAYRKHGFEIAQAVMKDIGGGFVMDDYIMEKPVRREAGGGRRQDRGEKGEERGENGEERGWGRKA